MVTEATKASAFLWVRLVAAIALVATMLFLVDRGVDIPILIQTFPLALLGPDAANLIRRVVK